MKNKKQIKKAIKKFNKLSNLLKVTLIIVFLVVVGLGFYLYTEGYFDQYLNEKPIDQNYSSQQNEAGYYYYSEQGFESGAYYEDALNLTGEALEDSLRTIVNTNFNAVSYGDARYVLSYADRITKDGETYVYGMYDEDKIATEWIGSGEGAWQREHVWPNSKLGIERVENSSRNQGSDLHNLRAITGINQSRSNRYFADGSNEAKTIGTEAFYPGDEHKGDVARILFYMVIKYDFLNLTDDVSKLTNDSTTNYTLDGAYSGLLSLMIKWHKEDPVNQFEKDRNNFIYEGVALNPSGKEIKAQGNRNPFIDKPELAHLIFEDVTIESITKQVEEINYDDVTIIYATITVTTTIDFQNKKYYF